MKTIVAIVCFSSVLGLSLAQFPNGRILEPPVPQLCANRVIHERAPDNKGYNGSWRTVFILRYSACANYFFFWLNV